MMADSQDPSEHVAAATTTHNPPAVPSPAVAAEMVTDAVVTIETAAAGSNAPGSTTSDSEEAIDAEAEPSMKNFIRILGFSKPLDKCLMVAGVVSAAGAGVALPLMNIVFGRLVGSFSDYFIPGSSVTKDQFLESVNHNTLYLLYLFIGKFCLGYISIFAFRMTGIRISAMIRMAYLTALFAQPISAIDRLPPGTATDQLTTTANAIQLGISDKLAILVQGLALVISAYVVAFVYSWALTLVSSAAVLFIVIVYSVTTPFYMKAEASVQKCNSRASGVAGEVLKSVRTVKSLNAEDCMVERYSKWIRMARQRGLKMSWITGAQFSPAFFGIYANMGLTFWFGVRLYTQNDIPGVGNIVTVLFSVLLVVSTLGNVVVPIQYISKAAVVSVPCFSIIDASRVAKDGLKDLGSLQDLNLRFSSAKFAYPSRPEVPILQGLDLTFPAGKITAIVGPSGSGKSTIVGLLERWYQLSDVNKRMPAPKADDEEQPGNWDDESDDAKKKTSKRPRQSLKDTIRNLKQRKRDKKSAKKPVVSSSRETVLQNSGIITFGEHNIEDLDLVWWRSQIGLVQQEPFLFNNTIYENVALGLVGSTLEHASDSEKLKLVEEACQEAYADEFIRRLPEGYQTKVGESGIKLSGGQRQRLAIARSIIKRPSVLILDEATSSIDVRGERIVQAALDRVSKGRTTITIAHRLSTIKKADHIIVLKDGCNVEEGSHEELVTRDDGIYRNLVLAQRLELGTGEDDAEASFEDEDYLKMANDRLERSKSQHSVLEDDSAAPAVTEVKFRGFFTSMGRFLYEQRKHYLLFAFVVLAGAGAGAVFALQAYLFSKFVTVFQQVGDDLVRSANFWALMFFVLALFVAVCYATIGFCSNSVSVYVSTTYRREYFMSILGKPIGWYDAEPNSSGTLTSRLSNDPSQIQEILGANMALPLIAIFNILGCTVISFSFGWKLTLVAFFAALPVILVAAFFRLRYELVFEAFNAKVFAESSQFASESIGAFRTVTSLTLEESILKRYQTLLDEHVHKAFMKARLAVLVFALSDSVELLSMALTFWYGGQLLASHEYDVTQFFVIYVAIVQGGQAAGQFLGFGPNIARANAAADRILGFRGEPEVPYFDEKKGLSNPEWVDSDMGVSIDFSNVSFKYPTRDAAVFRQLSLSIAPGSYVAFVGPSGCGKTTVISLLERFYSVSLGKILIDGSDIAECPVGTYRQHVALVSQEPTIFAGSVRDNLKLGIPGDVADEDLEQAAKSAEIHDFITSLPHGYSTELSGGTHASLSGGQKQRLCIARALLRKPKILLLDEATSSLDSQSEKLVQKAIERVAGSGRVTIVVVAHRLATIQNADRILVLGEGGKILEDGKHSDLVREKGVYWGMCRAQALDR